MLNCSQQTFLGRRGRMRLDSHAQPPCAPRYGVASAAGRLTSYGAAPSAAPRSSTASYFATPQQHLSGPSSCAILCRSAPAAEPLTSTPAQPSNGPNFTLHCEETGTAIHVFGVEHLAPQPHIGEWLIRQRPAAVIVETAMGPEHGSLAGNVIRCGDQVADPTAAFYLRMFCQIGVTLQDFKDGDFTASPLWNQVRTSYNGEQLAYIGAFATGAPLVFGDRPKDITYRRLFGLTTVPQLDEGYSFAAVQNYRAFMGLPPHPYDPDNLPVTEQITMQEREAVMLSVAYQLCTNRLPQQHLNLEQEGQGQAEGQAEGAAEGAEVPKGPKQLALVVGSAHLPGLEHLWRSGKWREVVGGGASHPLAASQLLSAPQLPDPDSDPAYGLRRGLLEAMLRLSVTREVLADLESVLGPVPERQSVSYTAVQEVYGSPRMQLASLPRELLGRAVEGLGCDFHEVLQPMRDIRPLHGGPGYSEDMVTYVRALNFELE